MQTKTKFLTLSFVLLSIMMMFVFSRIHSYKQVQASYKESEATVAQLERTPKKILPDQIPDYNFSTKTNFEDLLLFFPKQPQNEKRNTLDKTYSAYQNNVLEITFSDSSKFEIRSQRSPAQDYLNNFHDAKAEAIFKDFYKKHHIESNYEVLKYAFHLRPSSIKWFDSRTRTEIKRYLLNIKKFNTLQPTEITFLNIEFEAFKGFVFGTINESTEFFVTGYSSNDKRYSIVTKNINLDELLSILKQTENNAY